MLVSICGLGIFLILTFLLKIQQFLHTKKIKYKSWTWITVDDRQMGHVNQVGHLSKTPLNLLKIHKIGSVDTFESKQQNYDQI